MSKAVNSELQGILQRQLNQLLQEPCYGFDKSQIIVKTYVVLKIEKLRMGFPFFLLVKK